MNAPRVTAIDVAQEAGVSQSTVSRALAGSRDISEETRSRVARAAAELGYHIDARAARLRRGRAGTLAIVVIGRPGLTAAQMNGFHYALLGATCEAAAEHGFDALVSFQSQPDRDTWAYVARGQADGLIVLGSGVNRAAWDSLRATGGVGPLATWGAPHDDLPWVRAANTEGARLAVERLVAAGHRRIAFVGPVDDDHPQFSERFDGFRAAMHARGLEAASPIGLAGNDRARSGRDAVREILSAATPCDAIVAANDMIALGALEALAQAGRRVPEDFGVIGFDNLAAGAHSHPALTTIGPDFAAAGRRLVALACGTPGSENRVPVGLVERGSVRRASGE